MTVWLGSGKRCRRAKEEFDRCHRLDYQVEKEGEVDDSNHSGKYGSANRKQILTMSLSERVEDDWY